MTQDEIIKASQDRSDINNNRPAHSEKIEQANKKSLDRYAKYYTYIGTLSGSAIMLSITFLGKIKHITRADLLWSIDNINLLQLAWIAFGLTIIFTLMFNKKYLDVLYWDVMVDHATFEEKDSKNKLSLHDLGLLSIIGVTSNEEMRGQRNVTERNTNYWKSQKEVAVQKRKKSEKFNQNVIWFIHISFILGILLLISFAIATTGI